jgi:predicted ATP-binding protein involved in virulence
MRLQKIEAFNIPPLVQFSVDQLSDTVVLAGPNGVGKTRLVDTLLQFFQNPSAYSGSVQGQVKVRLIVDATNEEEKRAHWILKFPPTRRH